jgi:hypothetical protein
MEYGRVELANYRVEEERSKGRRSKVPLLHPAAFTLGP